MCLDNRNSELFPQLVRILIPLLTLIETLYVSTAAVYVQFSGVGSQFRFNDLYTTPFGPAYADIVTKDENFLEPPVGQTFSYALCYYSGPAVGTPVPANGSASINPPLPCILSSDGKSANCTCYGLSTEQYPPYVPYFIDINAILNLDLYLSTIAVCGHGGANCNPREPIRENTTWNKAPACQAANSNMVIPAAQLISVFSTVLNGDYGTGSTSCAAGKYAGCMTAPCYYTGNVDSAGNALVECRCPVYNGPFEIGQANMPCDANKLTPRPAYAGIGSQLPQQYVWSAAHNPKRNHPDPPATGCLPDMAGDKGCPLYIPGASYPVSKGSLLCTKVCESYRKDIRQSTAASFVSSTGIQVAYSCDAALCTTL